MSEDSSLNARTSISGWEISSVMFRRTSRMETPAFSWPMSTTSPVDAAKCFRSSRSSSRGVPKSTQRCSSWTPSSERFRAARGRIGHSLGSNPVYQRKDAPNFEWGKNAQTLHDGCVNRDMSSSRSIPVVSYSSDRVDLIGAGVNR